MNENCYHVDREERHLSLLDPHYKRKGFSKNTVALHSPLSCQLLTISSHDGENSDTCLCDHRRLCSHRSSKERPQDHRVQRRQEGLLLPLPRPSGPHPCSCSSACPHPVSASCSQSWQPMPTATMTALPPATVTTITVTSEASARPAEATAEAASENAWITMRRWAARQR